VAAGVGICGRLGTEYQTLSACQAVCLLIDPSANRTTPPTDEPAAALGVATSIEARLSGCRFCGHIHMMAGSRSCAFPSYSPKEVPRLIVALEQFG
jgi:hypothetical protein